MDPIVRREDERIFCLWMEQGLGIGFEQLREKPDGLHGELSVQTIDASGGKNGHIHWARLNLSSTSARLALARFLATRVKRGAVDWHSLIEYACTATALKFREGTPAEGLSTVTTPPDKRYALYPMLPLGQTCVLYGDGGSGKSLLAMSIAIAMATQHPLPSGFRPMLSCSALYLDYETNKEEQASRLRLLSRGFGLVDAPEVHYRQLVRPLADDLQSLREDMRRIRPGLLIVDSIAPACGGEPESAEVILRFMNTVREIGPSTTRLILSHISKSDMEKRRARPFGSSFTRNMARSCWEIRRSNEEEMDSLTVGLFHDKSNEDRLHGARAITFGFEVEDRITMTTSEIADSPDLAASSSLASRIRSALRSGAKTLRDLAEELEAKPKSLDTVLRRMRDVMQIDRAEGRGGRSTWGLRSERDPGQDG